jgi:hypothetical protein
MDLNEEYSAIQNALELQYFYVQELHWTNAHFIIESLEEGIMKTLVAYPHVENPSENLVDIQEYLLERLNVHYRRINLMKFITRKDDEMNIKCEIEDSLVIKCLSQDNFFTKILDLSIQRKSSYIAAIFFKNYFFEGNISTNLNGKKTDTSNFNKINLRIKQRIDQFYQNHELHQLPIFIINTNNKDKFRLTKQSIIEEMKAYSSLELRRIIYTSINEETLINVIQDSKSNAFINNILGQVWDISLDLNHNSYNSSDSIISGKLIPTLNDYSYNSLIIILNQNYLHLDLHLIDSIIL